VLLVLVFIVRTAVIRALTFKTLPFLAKGDSILLLGPMGSGKTALYFWVWRPSGAACVADF